MTAAVRKLETGGQGIPARLRSIADELEAASLPASSLGLLVIATVDARGLDVDCIGLGSCDVLRSLGILELAKDQVLRGTEG